LPQGYRPLSEAARLAGRHEVKPGLSKFETEGRLAIGHARRWVEATQTYAACESAKAQRLNHAATAQDNAETTVFENSLTKTIRDPEGRSVTWLFRIQCLPDTVDSRGPKGK
jgi:hypothetical protein